MKLKKIKKTAVAFGIFICIAFSIFTSVQHSQANAVLVETDETIGRCLDNIQPNINDLLVSAFTEQVSENQSYHRFAEHHGKLVTVSQTGGNGTVVHSKDLGGLLTGSSEISRIVSFHLPDPDNDYGKIPGTVHWKGVEYKDAIRIEIRCGQAWCVLPGEMKVDLIDDGTRLNRQYLNLLLPELERHGIKVAATLKRSHNN